MSTIHHAILGETEQARSIADAAFSAGHPVTSWGHPAPEGARTARYPGHAAAVGDCIIVVADDTLTSARLLFGRGAVALAAKSGAEIVEVSPADDATQRRHADRIRALGKAYRWCAPDAGTVDGGNSVLSAASASS